MAANSSELRIQAALAPCRVSKVRTGGKDAASGLPSRSIAAQEAADDARSRAAAAVPDLPQAAAGRCAHDLLGRHRWQVEVTAEQMPMVVGEKDHLAGFDLD